MKLEWHEDLAIGVKAIDEQHRELFHRFGMLLDACNCGCGQGELGSLILFLDEYIQSHFRDEERLQLECDFPDYLAHREQHRIFIGKILELKKVMRSEGTTLSLIIGTNVMLMEWLAKHISVMDKKIGEFILQQKPPCESHPTL